MKQTFFRTDHLKKAATGLLIVLAIITVSVWQYSDQSSKQNLLEDSLNILGHKLLAMVPPGNSKATLSELYDNFKQKAISGLVGEEEVEQVAANILNASNKQSELTPGQAQAIIAGKSYSSPWPEAVTTEPKDSMAIVAVLPAKRPQHKPPPPEFGKRILAMVRINDHMTDAFKKHDLARKRIATHVRYRAEKGLKIELDRGLRNMLPPDEVAMLNRELKRVDNLEWCDDLAVEIEKESRLHRAELDSLHAALQTTHSAEIERALAELDQLKQLQDIGISVNIDSIKTVVRKQLQATNTNPSPD